MKFIVPKYSCIQNPWLGDCRPLVAPLSPTEFVEPHPRKNPGYATALYKAPGPVWTGAENLAPTEIRSLDRPVRSVSLILLGCQYYICGLLISEFSYLSFLFSDYRSIIMFSLLNSTVLHIWKTNKLGITYKLDLTVCRYKRDEDTSI